MPKGQGLVNGRGAINGTGLVNGTGMINGTKGEARLSGAARQRRFVTRWQFLAILAAIIVVVPTFVYLSYSHQATEFVVDGNFAEWSSVDTFSPYVKSGVASIDIDEWAAVPQNDRLFMYLMTDGDMMTGSEVSSFYLFVDADNSLSTGYSVSGIGADYLLEVDGWNGSVQSTSVSQYSSATDHLDWNSWHGLGSMSVSAAGDQLEAMATMPTSLVDSTRFMLLSQNAAEQNSISYTVPAKGGVLVISQEPGPAIGSDGTVVQSASSSILRLHITCDGADGTINSISGGLAGMSLASPIEDIDVYVGVENVVDVMVDTSASSEGSSVTVDMALATIDSTFSDVEILGEGVSAYVGNAPASIQIDGAFGDWAGRTTADSDSLPVPNANIDIGAVGAVNDSTASYFYVSVLGTMCGGSYVPLLKEKPSGGGGGGIIVPTRKTGEDILDIYIDSDMSSSTGYLMSLSSKVIGADQKIEIRGLNGEIVKKSFLVYSAGDWTSGPGSITAAKDLQRIELSVSSSSLNGASSIDYIVETTDWRGRSDLATSVPQGSRALTGGLPTGASIESWAVDSPTSSSEATAMSYQRKLFYDGTNYWSFFWDGTNTVYKYSTDGGHTWILVGSFFKTSGVNEVSIWYYAPGNIVYAVGDTSSASTNIYFQRGVVSPASHTISWAPGQDNKLAVSMIALGGKNTYISRDAGGHLWVMSSNCTQTTPTRYALTVFRSAVVDSASAWVYSGNMLDSDSPQPVVKGSILPAGTGSNMWAVYGNNGNVAARQFNGTWSAETLIYSIGTGNPENTENSPPCAVVDTSGVIHVVYGDGHEQPSISKPYIYYVYNSGGAWSTPLRLDSAANNVGNVYPTISLDASSGIVYAFWILTDTAGVGQTIMCKKNVIGTWISVSIGNQTAGAKQYLTSVYSAPSENAICFQWTQNVTDPIEVQFDKLPEFKDVAVPVFVMICLFILYRGRGRRREEHD